MMRRSTFSLRNVAALLLTGGCLGVLIGLSISPVLHLIVGSVLAIAASVVGGLAGLPKVTDESADARHTATGGLSPVDPLPFMPLVIGLALGSPAGILIRTNDLLGPRPDVFAAKWSGTGMNGGEIQRRLLDTLYPGSPPTDVDLSAAGPRLGGGLYGLRIENCQLLTLREGDELRDRLLLIADARLAAAVGVCRDPACFAALRTMLCGKPQ